MRTRILEKANVSPMKRAMSQVRKCFLKIIVVVR